MSEWRWFTGPLAVWLGAGSWWVALSYGADEFGYVDLQIATLAVGLWLGASFLVWLSLREGNRAL